MSVQASSTVSLLVLIFVKEACFASETEIEDIYGDEGSTLILPCKRFENDASPGPVMWRRPGKDDNHRMSIHPDNSLILTGLNRNDAGIYTCSQDNDSIINRVHVYVKTPPPALANVTVVPSTIFALLKWDVADTGGCDITHFTAQYRLKYTVPNQAPDPWHLVIPGVISPTATQIDVYQLEPNSTYIFQVWANNRLGRGDVIELEGKTKHDNQEIELAKHLLEGAETFDTRIWVAAVAVVMGTLLVLATATIYALWRECRLPLVLTNKDAETMELIPNIILNPGYDFVQSEWVEPDENSNDTATVRLNNNSVVQPVRI